MPSPLLIVEAFFRGHRHPCTHVEPHTNYLLLSLLVLTYCLHFPSPEYVNMIKRLCRSRKLLCRSTCIKPVHITNQQRMSLVGELGDRRDESQRSNPSTCTYMYVADFTFFTSRCLIMSILYKRLRRKLSYMYVDLATVESKNLPTCKAHVHVVQVILNNYKSAKLHVG